MPPRRPYPVQAGDTLRGIALAVYGDADLWYQIANANGLRGDQDLRVGQTINIPTKVGLHNNASTYTPYDPSKVTGSTSPNLPTPVGNSDGGCGTLGTIIVVAVAIAVTVITQGAAAEIMGSVVAGALGGAAGSIASQAVGNVIGVQDGFSWNAVGDAALAGGIMGGLSPAPGAASGGWAAAATRAAVANVATQGIRVAVGSQDHFEWKKVAASAVGGGVGGYLNDTGAFAEYGDLGGRIARAGVTGLATAAAGGGKIEVQVVAADAFGNALGSSFGETVLQGTDQSPAESARLGRYQASAETQRAQASYAYRNGADVESDNATAARQRRDALYGLGSAGNVRLGGDAFMRQEDVEAQRVASLQRFLDMNPVADLSGNALGILPSDDRGFFPDSDAQSAARRTSDPKPGMNHAEVVRRVAAGAADEGDVRMHLDREETAARAAAERRYGLAGALRGVNDFGVDTVRSPYYLYTSLRDNGLGGTAGLMLEGMVNTPSMLYNAYDSGDMQSLTAAGLGVALGLKVPGGRVGGLAERSAIEFGERPGLRLGEAAANSDELRFSVGPGEIARRNYEPLSDLQKQRVVDYAAKLGVPEDKVVFWNGPTAYSPTFESVWVGPNVYPGAASEVRLGGTGVIDRLSMETTMAHEVVGHRESFLAGRDFADGSLLDEAQASYRAAALTPDLSSTERYQLLRDVVRRVNAEGLKVRDLDRSQFYLGR
jgi:hypothetical protein